MFVLFGEVLGLVDMTHVELERKRELAGRQTQVVRLVRHHDDGVRPDQADASGVSGPVGHGPVGALSLEQDGPLVRRDVCDVRTLDVGRDARADLRVHLPDPLVIVPAVGHAAVVRFDTVGAVDREDLTRAMALEVLVPSTAPSATDGVCVDPDRVCGGVIRVQRAVEGVSAPARGEAVRVVEGHCLLLGSFQRLEKIPKTDRFVNGLPCLIDLRFEVVFQLVELSFNEEFSLVVLIELEFS